MADTFTLKHNAKRAASRMIANGSAPSLDFEIVPHSGGFAIKWGKPIAALAPVAGGEPAPLVQYQKRADATRAAEGMLSAGNAPGSKFLVAGEGGAWSIIWTVGPKPAKTNGDAKPTGAPKTREGTKQEAVITMMRRPEGASTNEIIKFTGWKIVRGFVAGTVKKKLGLPVTAEKIEGRGTVYRIPPA